MTISPELRHAYNFHKAAIVSRAAAIRANKPLTIARGDAALRALNFAKQSMSTGLKHWTNSVWEVTQNGAANERGERWIEKPSACGLRFVGYADDLSRHIQHKGWFTDPDQQETIRGVVYQLPGRNGKARFVAGHDNPDNGAADADGPAFIDFSTIHESDFESEMRNALRQIGKSYHTPAMFKASYWAEGAHETARKEAARAADSFAERQAEKEREYNTAWRAGSDWASVQDEIATARSEFFKLNGQRRALLKRVASHDPEQTFTAICDAVTGTLERLASRVAELREEAAKLASGDAPDLYFFPHDKTLAVAFNDGAGKAVLRVS